MPKRNNLVKRNNLYFFFWLGAAMLIIAGIMNLQGSYEIRDYHCVDGKIIDTEVTQVLQKGGYQTRYNYTIQWTDQGVTYEEHAKEMLDSPDVSITKVWVNPENTHAFIANPFTTSKHFYVEFGLAVLAAIVGYLLRTRTKNRKRSKDELENIYYTAVAIVIVGVLADAFLIYLYPSTTKSYGSYIYLDFIWIIAFVIVFSIGIIIKLKAKLR